MGFSEQARPPRVQPRTDVIVGTLDYGRVRVASATMGLEYRQPDPGPVLAGIAHSHALAPVADLPVRKVETAVHRIADMTLALGTVEHDCLA